MSALDREGRALVAAALALAALLVGVYLAAGGGGYTPTAVADPCAAREWRSPEGVDEAAQQFFLSALDGASCELGVSREQLAAALATEQSRREFAAAQGIDDARLEAALRAGVDRAIDDAERAGAISGLAATGLRELVARLPVGALIDLVGDAGTLFGDLDGLLGRVDGLLDSAGELIP